jgi:hypothetical protein
MRPILSLIIAAGCLLGSSQTIEKIRLSRPMSSDDGSQLRELRFLPNSSSVRLVSLGYHQLLADILWFSTINYFGKHQATDGNLPWLYALCDTITTLDPRALHVYEFGATMLSWEVGQPAMARQLLTKAIDHNGNEWRLYYLRGFTTYFFLKNPQGAKDDLKKAASFPGVHPTIIRLAAKSLAEFEGPDFAQSLLLSALRTERDPQVRKVLTMRLRELQEAAQKKSVEVSRESP